MGHTCSVDHELEIPVLDGDPGHRHHNRIIDYVETIAILHYNDITDGKC